MDVPLMRDLGKGDRSPVSRGDPMAKQGESMSGWYAVAKDGRGVESRTGRLTVAMTSGSPNGPSSGQRRQITSLLNSPLGSPLEQNEGPKPQVMNADAKIKIFDRSRVAEDDSNDNSNALSNEHIRKSSLSPVPPPIAPNVLTDKLNTMKKMQENNPVTMNKTSV